MLLGRYRLIGTGRCAVALSVRRFACCVASVVAAIAAVSVVFVPAAALAAGGPAFWQKSIVPPTVHSTRVAIQLTLDTEELATEYDIAYAPAEAGKAPLETSSAWELVNNGTTGAANGNFQEKIFIGSADPGEPPSASVQLRGLTPDTSYYARFVAKNAVNEKDGTEAVEKVPFKTLGVEKPGIDRGGVSEEENILFSEVGEESDTSVAFSAKIETNGSLGPTTYVFEYALAENEGLRPAEGSKAWLPFASGAGTIPGEYGKVEGKTTKLEPATLYYVRLKATNEVGEIVQTRYSASVALGEVEYFTTGPETPGAGRVVVRNVTADSAQLGVEVTPHGSRTLWRLQSSSTAAGPWSDVATGEVTQREAEAIPFVDVVKFGASFTGLSPSTGYYVRLVVKNEKGKEATGEVEHFETSGAPSAKTFAVHAVHGESWRLLGAVDPNSEPTSSEQMITVEGTSGGTFKLVFEGKETVSIEYNPEGKESIAEAIRRALEKLGGPKVGVEGPNAGPFRVFFVGLDEKVSEPSVEVGLSAGVKVVVSSVVLGGEAYDARYRFQYRSASSNGAGWEETPEEDVGSGDVFRVVGVDVAGLASGGDYRYRVVASSNAPGTSPVEAVEQTLVVPGVTVVGTGAGGCLNEAFRTGLSSRLPDCRAYEQVTPVDKEGAQEPFHYRGGITTAVLVGEGGDRVTLEAPLANYGSGPGSGQSPYFFSRVEGKGWEMLAGSPQPETGVYGIHPQVYSADLAMVAFRAEYGTSVSSESPNIEYKIGRAGGPYTLVASVPSKDVSDEEGWVAANGDFSKLVLQVADHVLLGEPTGTVSGPDLYEYTVDGGGLRQLNVDEQGSTIGSCGATIVHGEEGGVSHVYSGPHSISADGSRVFFEAVPPGGECAGSKDLYMRVDGSETVDIGAYEFMAADADGTTLLLKNADKELFSYDTRSGVAVAQSGSELASAEELGSLDIPAQKYSPEAGNAFAHSRYAYFTGGVAGLPGDGIVNAGETEGTVASQVYRYDSGEHVVECVSCASSSDPEPEQDSYLDGIQGQPFVNGGLPEYTLTSANGDFAFFTTTAALVREDVDGEIPAIISPFSPSEYVSVGGHTSPSTDVYEWRRDGLDGCVQLQGCLALITDGRGGYLNLLLGSANEGADVFIDTHSKLLGQDKDTAGDIYDVRVDGGLPEASPPAVECEADACSAPPSPPNDTTPSSFTFNGKGNVVATKKPVVKPQKHKAKKPKKKKAGKTRQVRGGRGKAKKSEKGARRR